MVPAMHQRLLVLKPNWPDLFRDDHNAGHSFGSHSLGENSMTMSRDTSAVSSRFCVASLPSATSYCCCTSRNS